MSIAIVIPGRTVLIIVAIVMVFFRLCLFVDFIYRTWDKGKAFPSANPTGMIELLRRPTARFVSTATIPTTSLEAKHKALLDEDWRTFDVMLVGGAIGIAAWGQLFAASGSSPGDRLSGLTLHMLLAGTACLLAGPLIWRARGLYLTALGRKASQEVGFSLIVLSLASVVIDLRVPFAMEAGLVVACAIVVREMADNYIYRRDIQRRLNYDP
ncbi:hypothetical protein [Rhodococcus wratislaviensis]|uniref:Uncharacterized protein n=1 Tax=Rhodococcus wratislaviensis NBRC 100605 TaxID=1219028 RepID=X0QB30_RHOWR|nr:hypothetical protein [Rhodococcus wratislaviensis]GAF48116.1 hypothetical protein RW1_049_00250 [Rhodococcus wratislaviensis NBRC 100605]